MSMLLLMPAGSKDIPVGTAVAWLVEEADEVAAFKDINPGGKSYVCLCVPAHPAVLSACLLVLLQTGRQ